MASAITNNNSSIISTTTTIDAASSASSSSTTTTTATTTTTTTNKITSDAMEESVHNSDDTTGGKQQFVEVSRNNSSSSSSTGADVVLKNDAKLSQQTVAAMFSPNFASRKTNQRATVMPMPTMPCFSPVHMPGECCFSLSTHIFVDDILSTHVLGGTPLAIVLCCLKFAQRELGQ